MAYTATKVNPRTEKGLFKIDVEIRDDKGEVVTTETFETNQDQPGDWPAEGAKRLIQSLEAMPALPQKIAEGLITLPDDAVVDTAKNEWLNDHSLAMRLKQCVDLGYLAEDDAEYVALLVKNKKGFKSEYLT